MGKTILVLTGSVRKNGNSEQLAEAFIEGAVSSGKQILRFDAAFKDSNTAERFESLLGKNVIYKDSDGRIAAGMMMEITKISERFYDTYQCSIRQVDETEAVEYE